jgi:D-tyrosyl-tRNA(Tyr) deacylase
MMYYIMCAIAYPRRPTVLVDKSRSRRYLTRQQGGSMRVVIQRVTWARVKVNSETVGVIDNGIMALVGATTGDTDEDARSLAEKTVNLRIFEDQGGKMNLSLLDVAGSLLAVSQFTLYADTGKGRRPAFTDALEPVEAKRLYELFKSAVAAEGVNVASGVFGAHMDVELCNSGPVTIILSSDVKRK